MCVCADVCGFLISLCKSALKCVGKRMHFVLLKINAYEICILDISWGNRLKFVC